MIGDTLQAFDDDHQLQAARDVARLLLHARSELTLKVLVQAIRFVIAPNDGPRLIDVAADESIEGELEHFQGQAGETGYVDLKFKGWLIAQFEAAPGDSGGFIADPFEFARDLHDRH